MFNFRKIASVASSALMVGSTIGLALAANYPAPFVTGGQHNVAIVVGANAAVTDQTAANALSTDLGDAYLAGGGSAGTGTTTAPTGGDFVKLEKPSDKFNLGNTMSGVFGSTVDKDDLEVLLAAGTYQNDENTEYDYDQKLTLFARTLEYFADDDFEGKEPTVGFNISSSTTVLNYTLDFDTGAESDVSSSDLADFETTDLQILGKSYYILDADNATSTTDHNYFGKFTMLDSANTATVTEGETITVTAGTKSYEVGIDFVGTSSVRLNINGALTNSLAEGETQRLSDGSYVGIRDILVQDYAGGIKKVEFSIGSGKLEVDTGADIELNDETVEGVKGWFYRGSGSGSKVRLSKVVLTWTTEDEEFIAPGSDLTMPGFGAVKFSMTGFNIPTPETIQVNYDGDDSIELKVPIKDGDASISILGGNASGDITVIGKDATNRLATRPGTNLVYYKKFQAGNYHKWFVATHNDTDDAESYLLSASFSASSGKNYTTFKNEVTNSDICALSEPGDDCDIGDVSFNVVSVIKNSTEESVNITAGTGTNFYTLFTKEGLRIILPFSNTNESTGTPPGYGYNLPQREKGAINFSADASTAGYSIASYYLNFDEEDKDDNKLSGLTFNVTIDDDSDNDLNVASIDTAKIKHDILGTSDDTTSRVVSDLATEVKRIVVTDRGKAEVVYSGTEASADVYLTAPSATAGTGGGVLGDIVVNDNEITSVSGKNLIVLGGSCINTAARQLVDSAATAAICGADFTAKTGVGSGEFMIKSFSSPWSTGKIALLVAGYEAEDTVNAATALRTQKPDTASGKSYTGTTGTATISVLS